MKFITKIHDEHAEMKLDYSHKLKFSVMQLFTFCNEVHTTPI